MTDEPDTGDVFSGPTPPQSKEAEEHLLGACMMSGRAIDAAVEAGVGPADFYYGTHGRIFEAAVALHASGQPVDGITLEHELDRHGALDTVGGRVRLVDLGRIAPATGNAAHYAKIVRDLAVARALIRAGAEISRIGFEQEGREAEALMADAEELVFGLSRERARSEFVHVGDAVMRGYQKLVELHERGGADVVGLASGMVDLDRRTAGFHPGNLFVIAARPSMGKAQPMDALVLTPYGWREMGDLAVGETVVGKDGKPKKIISVHDRGELPVFLVRFDDGAKAECCDDHLWLTTTRLERRNGHPGTARPLSEIRSSLVRPDGNGWNHAIPFVEPVEMMPLVRQLPVHPYLLGLYLAEGDCHRNTIRISNTEPDVIERASACLPPGDKMREDRGKRGHWAVSRSVYNRDRSETSVAIEGLGLLGKGAYDKFVPDAYLRASIEDRAAFLRGLCDGDGYVTTPGRCSVEVSLSSQALAAGVGLIVRSLGGRWSVRAREVAATKDGVRTVSAAPSYRMILSFPASDFVPVSSDKHLARWRIPKRRTKSRRIVAVEANGRAECRCISVEDGFYVTEGHAVTHNSGLALSVIAHVGVRVGVPVALFTLEMSRDEVVQRFLSMEGRVDGHKIRTGRLSRDEWQNVTAAADRVAAAPIYVEDSSGLTISEVRSRARRLKAQHPTLGLVVVDYIQLLTSGRAELEGNRVQDVSVISRQLKVIAGELDVPVIALSQLSRQVEQRHDKRPLLSDLRESGSIEQDADVVAFIYRDEYYNPEDTDQHGIAEINLAKHRNGPTDTIKVTFSKRFARFHDLQLPGTGGQP